MRNIVWCLIEALNHDNDVERRVATGELIDCGAEAVAPLVQALADPRPRVRWGAAIALGRIPGITEDGISSLVKQLGDHVERVRQCAAESLVYIGERAVPALASGLAGSNPDAQARAAIVLGQIGPPAGQAVSKLVELLSNDDDFVRLQSATALGRIGVQNVAVIVNALSRALPTQDERISEALITILRETGDSSDPVYCVFVEAYFRGSRRVSEAAITAIRKIRPGAIRKNRKSISIDIPSKLAAQLFREQYGGANAAGRDKNSKS